MLGFSYYDISINVRYSITYFDDGTSDEWWIVDEANI